MLFRKFNYILCSLLLPLLLLGSCKTKIDDPRMKVGDDTIFMEGFLNPVADSITIGLSVAKGAVTSGNKIKEEELLQAEVSIESEGVVKRLSFSHWNNTVAVYVLSAEEMPVVAGNTYTVRVHREGVFSAFASTTVPGGDFDFTFDVTGPVVNSNSGERTYKVSGYITDEKDAHNYYRLTSDDTARGYTYNELLLADNPDVPGRISFKADVTEDMYEMGSGILFITHITKDLYLYLTTIRNLEDNDGNPFAEPSTLYSNVQGGLGILGGMNTKGRPVRP